MDNKPVMFTDTACKDEETVFNHVWKQQLKEGRSFLTWRRAQPMIEKQACPSYGCGRYTRYSKQDDFCSAIHYSDSILLYLWVTGALDNKQLGMWAKSSLPLDEW